MLLLFTLSFCLVLYLPSGCMMRWTQRRHSW
jgi:hypothetical protein